MAKKFTLTPVSSQDIKVVKYLRVKVVHYLLLQTTNLLLNKIPYHDTLNTSKEYWTDSSFYNRDKMHTLLQVDYAYRSLSPIEFDTKPIFSLSISTTGINNPL